MVGPDNTVVLHCQSSRNLRGSSKSSRDLLSGNNPRHLKAPTEGLVEEDAGLHRLEAGHPREDGERDEYRDGDGELVEPRDRDEDGPHTCVGQERLQDEGDREKAPARGNEGQGAEEEIDELERG